MATLKAVVRTPRQDGFYPVYIRVTHHRSSVFIKTDKMLTKKELTKTNEIKDPYVLQFCTQRIIEYNEKLNRKDISQWTVKEVGEYLERGDEDICFSDYAREVHIARMINAGQIRNAKNYKLALGHMERFFGTNKVMFSHLTSMSMDRWIKSMANTARAKEMYPTCIRQIFRAAQTDYNDYDNGIIRIKLDPWHRVGIPDADRPEKKAITPEECRAFFGHAMPDSDLKLPLYEFARDVSMMILCLAGINTIDLYEMKKEDYHGGIIHYCRAKTKKSRNDNAYIEMRVPPILLPIFDKYLDRTSDHHLFDFHQRMRTSDSFNANVNIGLKQICRDMGIPKGKMYSGYTFRHTWATVAQNDCKASIEEVGFAMNHSRNKVTRGYIKIDFSPAWELNEKVVDFIFFSDKSSSRVENEKEVHFRLSSRYMVNGVAYYQGRKVAEFTDLGYNNVDDVIDKLASMMPDDIPDRAIVHFKLVNMDKDQTAVYQRQKGKGF